MTRGQSCLEKLKVDFGESCKKINFKQRTKLQNLHNFQRQYRSLRGWRRAEQCKHLLSTFAWIEMYSFSGTHLGNLNIGK